LCASRHILIIRIFDVVLPPERVQYFWLFPSQIFCENLSRHSTRLPLYLRPRLALDRPADVRPFSPYRFLTLSRLIGCENSSLLANDFCLRGFHKGLHDVFNSPLFPVLFFVPHLVRDPLFSGKKKESQVPPLRAPRLSSSTSTHPPAPPPLTPLRGGFSGVPFPSPA